MMFQSSFKRWERKNQMVADAKLHHMMKKDEKMKMKKEQKKKSKKWVEDEKQWKAKKEEGRKIGNE